MDYFSSFKKQNNCQSEETGVYLGGDNLLIFIQNYNFLHVNICSYMVLKSMLLTYYMLILFKMYS